MRRGVDRASLGAVDRDRALRAAWIGALFHAPGLWLAGFSLSPATRRENALALALTVVAMIAGGGLHGVGGVVLAWALGHATWSLRLARRALTNRL